MNLTPLEEDEQKAFVQWLELKKLKFTAIPNSTFTNSPKQKKRNRDMGLRPGLPDLLILTKKGTLFVEMKRRKGSTTSRDQLDWIEAINNTPLAQAGVCYGFDEAVAFVSRFI